MAGLLSPDLGAEIQGLLAQFQPSQAMQDQATRRELMAMGLAMLGARRGSELSTFGNAGLLGLQAHDDYIKNQQAMTAQNMQMVMPMLQLAQRQQYAKNLSDAFGQAYQSTPVDTQLPAGSVGGSGMGGGTAATFGPSSQPGPVTGPTANVPAYQANPAVRLKLAQLSAQGKALGMPDISGDVKLMFPDPIRVNAGGGVYNPITQQIAMTPKSVDGSLPVQGPDGSWAYQPVGNATSALAMPTVTKNLANLATQPQTGVLPGNGEGIVGTRLGALGGATGPYSFLNNVLAGPQASNAPAAQPQPRAPVQTKLSPEQETNSKALGEQAADYRTAMDQSSKAIAQLDQISDTLNYFKPGPTLPMRAKIAGYAQELPGVGRTLADTLVPNSATALPAIAAMEKFSVGLTAEQSKVFGSREGQQVIGMIKSAMPNAEQVPGAPETIIEAQKGVHQWIVDKALAAQQWLRDPANHGSLNGFSEAWDQTHPVSSYVGNLPALANIAKGLPPSAPREASGPITTGTPNATQIQYLRAHPQLRGQFDAKFGAGASAQYLR